MPILRKSLILLVLAAFVAAAPGPVWAGIGPVHAAHAMVCSVRPLATDAGVQILKEGGNAVDAAVATAFALAVVYPDAGNLGGGGFLLFRQADGESHFIDFRETAPQAATRDMYLDAKGNVIPGLSTDSGKAIAVPGSVAGLTYAQKKYGKLPLAKVMEPAIRLAREGFALTWGDADGIAEYADKLGNDPEAKRIFLRDGKLYQEGEILRQPELAQTLERIASNPDDFYHGEMARELAAAVQKDGGLITAADLAAYQVKERVPIHGTYRGYDIVSAPPPSAGGIVLVEALNILEGYDLAKMGQNSANAMHFIVEAYRRAFYDKSEFMGDPDFVKVPVAQLIDKKYAAEWRETIDPRRATPSGELQRPQFGDLDQMARAPSRHEGNNTTHFSVVDAEGNAVAVTTTLNDGFGAKMVAGKLGFLLNDEMDDFTSKPDAPNMFGLIQGSANEIAPGRRPVSSMTPTIVTKDGKLLLVTGSPGGPRIITTVANVLLGVIDFGLNVQEAVDAPRFHQQWMPDEIYTERTGFSPDTIGLLEGRGYKFRGADPNWPSGYWSDAETILVDPKTGERLGATDPRMAGKAGGY
jgi:gamma-glutamyltranspeptidase/glutathione hydrolase